MQQKQITIKLLEQHLVKQWRPIKQVHVFVVVRIIMVSCSDELHN